MNLQTIYTNVNSMRGTTGNANTTAGTIESTKIAGSEVTCETISQLSDQNLHHLAQEYGGNARKWQKRFAGLIPEIAKRQLYKKYGCAAIEEYAAKHCGMSHNTVEKILRVQKKLEGKLKLQDLMSSHGWSKLEVIATVATAETEFFWAEKVVQMSKETLQTFIRELRVAGKLPGVQVEPQDKLANVHGQNLEQQNIFKNSEAESALTEAVLQNFGRCSAGGGNEMQSNLQVSNCENLCKNGGQNEDLRESEITLKNGQIWVDLKPTRTAFSIKIDQQTLVRLRIFKQKLEKRTRKTQDWNNTLNALLDSAEREAKLNIQLAKAEKRLAKCELIAANTTKKGQRQTNAMRMQRSTMDLEAIKKSLPQISTRPIPMAVNKYLQEKYHGKCAYPVCKNPAEIHHHTRRFILNPNHDPDFIAPLCKNHERLFHLGLIANEEFPRDLWQIQLETDKNLPKYKIDLKVNQFRVTSNFG